MGSAIAAVIVVTVQLARGDDGVTLIPLISFGVLTSVIAIICALPVLFFDRASHPTRQCLVISNVLLPVLLIGVLFDPVLIGADIPEWTISVIGVLLLPLFAFALLPIGLFFAHIRARASVNSRVPGATDGDTPPTGGAS